MGATAEQPKVTFVPAAVDAKTTVVQEELTARILARGELEEAFRLSLEGGLNKYSGAALQMRAMLKMRRGDLDGAEELIDRSLRIASNYFGWKMAGDCAFLKSQFDRAEGYYRKALTLELTPEVVHDLAVAIVSQGRIEEALVHFREAIAIDPRPDFYHHLSIMSLLGGHHEEGWDLMKWRLQVPGVTGTFPNAEKYWNGEDVTGKVITVRTERGWGDAIQFSGYLPYLLARAKKVYVFCQRPLMTWFKHYFPKCIPWPHDAPPRLDFDYHVNIMCLPRLIKPKDYVRPPKREHKGTGVGFCWYGSPTHKADHLRTVPVERFGPISEVLGKKLLCLGYGRFDQKPDFVKYLVEESRDWLETCRIVEKRIRLIITVDTAIAHMGGFLGIPTWLLLPYVPDFRWGMTGEETQWYESVKLYRQPRLMDWDSVFERVKQDVAR